MEVQIEGLTVLMNKSKDVTVLVTNNYRERERGRDRQRQNESERVCDTVKE